MKEDWKDSAFLKKRSKRLWQIQAGLYGKAEASLANVFCCFLSRKQALLPLALPAAAHLGSYLCFKKAGLS
jgi:hypothetical protein